MMTVRRLLLLLALLPMLGAGLCPADAAPFVGSFWNTRTYHKGDGPCAGVLSGFQVDFDSEVAAVNAGYIPCSYCVPKPCQAYVAKAQRVKQFLDTYNRELTRAANAWAENAFGAASLHDYASGAAGLSLMAGDDAQFSLGDALIFSALNAVDPEQARRRFQDRFIAADAAEGLMMAALDLEKQAMRRETAAAMAMGYAVEYTVYVGQAMDALHASESNAEWDSIRKSVEADLQQEHYERAAITAVLGLAAAPKGTHETGPGKNLKTDDPADELHTKALREFALHGEWSPEQSTRLLNLGWDAGTHGHQLYGMALVSLVVVKEPQSKRARQVLDEIVHAKWQSVRAFGR